MKSIKKNAFSIIKFIAFFLILAFVFLKITYLFSMTLYEMDRQHIDGIKNEPKNSIDVLYVGGSAAFCYWQTPKAWHDYGMTSYLYATNAFLAENIEYGIKSAVKDQDPKLVVIDARPFQYWNDTPPELGLKIGADNQRASLDRMEFVHAALSRHQWDIPESDNPVATALAKFNFGVPFAIRIARYHSNYDAVLPNPVYWWYMNHTGTTRFRGSEVMTMHVFLEEPTDYATQERAELEPGCRETLNELLDYCDTQKFKVLFVVCPYAVSQAEEARYNAVSDLVTTRGYDFMDCNQYADEMGLDYESDFYNNSHVNALGGEKNTAFLADYIKTNFVVPDRRGEEISTSWDTMYQDYAAMEIAADEGLKSAVQDKKNAAAQAEALAACDDADVWCGLAKNPNYVTLFCAQGAWQNNDPQYVGLLNEWGIDASGNGAPQRAKVCQGTVALLDENAPTGTPLTIGEPAATVNLPSTAVITGGDAAHIVVDGVDYAVGREGMNVVVYDYNYNRRW